MYARQVAMKLRPNVRTGLTRILESEIVPGLRTQKGFKDELTIVSADGKDALAVSLWETRESAEAYGRKPYIEVCKVLSTLVRGEPRVKTFEVANLALRSISVQLNAR